VFNAGLAFAMTRDFSVTMGVSSQFNSKPPVGLKKTDTLALVGVALKLGN
jgi:putative salt-induced outer membrane protein YdiY